MGSVPQVSDVAAGLIRVGWWWRWWVEGRAMGLLIWANELQPDEVADSRRLVPVNSERVLQPWKIVKVTPH